MSTIKLRRSGVAGKIPDTSQLELGEIALNTHDGRLYIKKSVDSVESIVGFLGTPYSEYSITVDTFTGNGLLTNFTLSRVPKDEQYIYVSINGVLQDIDAYSFVGTTLTLSEAPQVDDFIEVRIHDNVTATVQVRDYARYVYTASNETVFTGTDDNGSTLTYDVGFVEVYVNGSRLVDGSDFTATTSTSIVISQAVTGIVEIVSLSRATFVDSQGGLSLTATSADFTTTDTDQVADTFFASAYRTAKYLVQISDNTDFHTTEVLLIHDGANAYITEYGTVFTNGSMGTIDADISSGKVRLLVTPTAINTTVKTQRITVTV